MQRKAIFGLLLMASVWTGCQKSFLEKLPLDELTEETVFKSYENFKTYAWGLYDYFGGYGNDVNYAPMFYPEFDSDNLAISNSGKMSDYAFQTKIVPATGGHTVSMATAEWNFSYIRRVNIMLDNIDGSSLTTQDKEHWRSVGYFFRALRYYDLIAAFGDVPWIEHALSDTAHSILFAPRTPRNEVAAQVLGNLQWAEQHIKPEGDGENTIDTHVVRALIARFGLFEGTWRKYHGLSDAEVYLRASAIASEKLIADFPALMDHYDDVFNSEDLKGKPGIILFKQYVANLTTNKLTRVAGSTSWHADVTKDAVESFLCTDGRPISTSGLYDGDRTMNEAFRNRDRRLYFTVVPPYKVKIGNPNYTWSPTGNALDSEYIDLMAAIGGNNKKLPMKQWHQTMENGRVINMSPHFRNFNGGQAQAITELGYFFWKFYNRMPLDGNNNSTNDAPLFRMGEVLLNYAEAKKELGELNQSIVDKTINSLRVRAGVSPMQLADITADFDQARDADVDPVLWEIRRERRVELMGEGFRLNDLKRWKKGHYVDTQELGVWVKNADFGNKLKIHGRGEEGYVEYFDEPLGWLEHYYLEPLPTQDMILNKNLKQNPDWK